MPLYREIRSMGEANMRTVLRATGGRVAVNQSRRPFHRSESRECELGEESSCPSAAQKHDSELMRLPWGLYSFFHALSGPRTASERVGRWRPCVGRLGYSRGHLDST